METRDWIPLESLICKVELDERKSGDEDGTAHYVLSRQEHNRILVELSAACSRFESQDSEDEDEENKNDSLSDSGSDSSDGKERGGKKGRRGDSVDSKVTRKKNKNKKKEVSENEKEEEENVDDSEEDEEEEDGIEGDPLNEDGTGYDGLERNSSRGEAIDSMHQVNWLGESVQVDNVVLQNKEQVPKLSYEGFQRLGEDFHVGDCVLIRGKESIWLGKILALWHYPTLGAFILLSPFTVDYFD